MIEKFREMLSQKIASFPNNPRGFKEFENYFRKYKVKAYYHQTRNSNRPSKRSAKLLLDNKENVGYDNPCSEKDWRWIDVKLSDGWYTFVVPADLYEKFCVLGFP